MNLEIKKMWVEALRSGEFRQGWSVLRDPAGGFCCLGVLCELHRQQTGAGIWVDSTRAYLTGENESVAKLTDEVALWAGLDSNNPQIHLDGSDHHLITLNDGSHEVRPRTFTEIADIIEAQL